MTFLPPTSRFHHVGVACTDLEAEKAGVRALGYESVGGPFTDRRQGVTGLFLEGIGPRLELLAPLEGSDVLDPWLRSKAKMYHLAYEVDDLADAIGDAKKVGARPLSPPVPAVAFEDRQICFLMLRSMLLVELIEAPPIPGS
jgi:methylmalonyl-CoA/ethylmalonyl-CoA epimerase